LASDRVERGESILETSFIWEPMHFPTQVCWPLC
jgi:hypothetical protein